MLLFHAYLSEDLLRFSQLVNSDKELQVRPGSSSSKQKARQIDVNSVDSLGRTVLHLAASDGRLDYAEVLLSSQFIDVAKPDRESGWTALHRALYSGKINIVRAILARTNIRSSSMRELLSTNDFEANTAFDVYNSTVAGVNPAGHQAHRGGSDLFTFGSNANHTLGFSDSDDRAFPERVSIKQVTHEQHTATPSRFRQHRIRDVVMSKYHTVVITADTQNNLYSCGFSKNGRLGTAGGTQFILTHVPVPGQVIAVAAAHDHTLAVTSNGDLYSWGSALQGQLGYDLETGVSFSSTPRKVIKLGKDTIIGVAASAVHSVCYSESSLWTWGQNNGQLGHELNTQDSKILNSPRKVTTLSAPVKQLTATPYATVCLLETDDVLIFTNYGYFKLALQLDRFASQYQVFRPRQSYAPSKIAKVTSGSATIAVMTNMGDVFAFSLDEATSHIKPTALAKSIKPNRVWSLRKKHMAIVDVAVGQEGSLIMCTKSGSVHLANKRSGRQKNDLSKADYKFSRVPSITRVIQVRANGHGAFGLVREDVPLLPIHFDSTDLAEDLLCTLPYSGAIVEEEEETELVDRSDDDSDHESKDGNTTPKHVLNACEMLRSPELTSSWDTDTETYDMIFRSQGHEIPCHKIICCARCPIIRQLILGQSSPLDLKLTSENNVVIIEVPTTSNTLKCLIIVVHWLYTDILLTPWIGGTHNQQQELRGLREDVRALALKLSLHGLAKAVSSTYIALPRPTLAADIGALQINPDFAPLRDINLLLSDGNILTHSAIVAARSEFFGAMLSGAWISARRSDQIGATINIDVKHISTQVMTIVLDHIFKDHDTSVFDDIDCADVDDFLDLVVSVMAASTELILPRLKQSCQAILQRFVHRKNVAIILTEADMYSADELKTACLDYCVKNLQFLLENSLLTNLSVELIHEMELYLAQKQLERLPTSKSGRLLSELIQRHPSVLEESVEQQRKYLQSLLLPPGDVNLHAETPLPSRQSGKRSTSYHAEDSPITRPLIDEVALPMFHMDDEPKKLCPKVSNLNINDLPTDEVNGTPARTLSRNGLIQAGQAKDERPAEHAKEVVRGWSAGVIATPSADLRATLNEGQGTTSKTPNLFYSPPVSKMSQRDRKKQGMAESPLPLLSATSPRSASPWTLQTKSPTVPLKDIAQQQQGIQTPRESSRSERVTVPQTPRRPSGTAPSPSLPRSTGSYSRSYKAPSSFPSPSQAGLTLAEIILAEETEKTKMEEYKVKRSMREIQEQEEFERWFAQESIRLRKEDEASAALALQLSQQDKSRRKNATKSKSKANPPRKTSLKPDAVVFTPRTL